MYDVEFIQDAMRQYGLVIRAIPRTERHIHEVYHANMYPNGTIQFLGKPFNREMLVVEDTPKHAGEFIIGLARHTLSIVSFVKNRYFKDIDEIMDYILYEHNPDDYI